MQRFTRYFAIACATVALAHLSIGRSHAVEEASWATVKQAIIHQALDGTTYFSFSAEALSRVVGKKVTKVKTVKTASAIKPVKVKKDKKDKNNGADLSAAGPVFFINEETRTLEGLIGWAGGSLKIKDHNVNGDNTDNLVVHLDLSAGTLDSDELITMTVYGETLSDLVVAFSPAGLQFNKPAILTIRLGIQLVDGPVDESIPIHHIYSDGTVEIANFVSFSRWTNGAARFQVEVPGFSRYGLRSR